MDYTILEVLTITNNMEIFVILFSLIFGMLIGSFLNVVALRFNTGKSLAGRSGCYSCGHRLSWYELLPIFSWLIQKGRCRSCSSKISPMYFIGEFTTAIFFGLVSARGILTNGAINIFTIEYLVATLFLFIVISLLMIIFLYDIRHKIIPDRLSMIFGILACASLFFFSDGVEFFNYVGFHMPDVWMILGGILVPLPFVILWIISKGRWLGLGDPKLMVGIGFLFGTIKGFSAVFLSFWIGALFAISIMLINFFLKRTLLRTGKKSIMKEEIPFAPFLIVGTIITLAFNISIF
jgi:prepilin signal peptidase PulO-like enzyme (type II secretory pathway)